ncbi:hypothetical protein GCM10010168_03650 [Actinoplanes ianthinogenes]|uniref:Uncharacterized protein n=1 Tax=Actinoplanes ianthinogenes TaxID=122358 RepID=A0ABM7LUC4_9ACTN|nr:hypothetical protein [Actinoplanes ianthinogenes]BCJ42895.1 hypothetical protein Aiant_35520 [Actinoplanes ianthinogenes]GGQ91552.1 hypothetical protein GCM10010168_03650 [Actinoplanes ianthinogenes]
MSAERDDGWPSIPTVLRVMAGWFLFGIGLLNLACGGDGTTYRVFHVTVTLGGMILLGLHRVGASRAGQLIATAAGVAGFGLGLLRVADRDAGWRGYPYPFLQTAGGIRADGRHLVFDLVFWLCAGTLALVVVRTAERCLPERRTPVDLAGYVGRHAEAPPAGGAEPAGGVAAAELGRHAEARVYVAQHRADENVGGLT